MASSYFVTFGDNRLTFPGATGSVAWEYRIPLPKTDQYVELWRNPGTSMVSSMPLSQPVSAFDALAISLMIPGTTIENTENIYYMPTTGLTGNFYQSFGVPYNRSASSPKWMTRMIKFSSLGTASGGTGITAVSGAVVQWNTWGTAINNATNISAISGVKYAK